MSNLTISIFGSKIFLDIISEVKFFSKFKIQYYEDLDLCIQNAEKHNQLVVFFPKEININFYDKIKECNFPLILIGKSLKSLKQLSGSLQEQFKIPFSIIDFEKKITLLFAKNEFKKNSLIKLNDYIIDKNERKIKKNNLEIQLSEKEVNFLILFSVNKEPISRNLVLKKVWKY